MPELPEVETMKRDCDANITGKTIIGVEVYDRRVLKDVAQKTFKEKMSGRTIESVQRRGKALVITFENKTYLVVQVKMTGHLVYSRKNLRKDERRSETKVVFHLSDGNYLNYNDLRLFGWLIPADDLRQVPYLNSVGVEPLNGSFRLKYLRDRLRARKTPVKPMLMDQTFIAGIGNIYASEILFRSGINPAVPSDRLGNDQLQKLRRATVSILKEAIRYRGTSMRDYRDLNGKQGKFLKRIRVYGRAGKPCYCCGQGILRIVQSGRSTFYCPKCQR